MSEMLAITQELLREYKKLHAEEARLRSKIKRLREELLQKLEDGADVEPGALTVEARHVPVRILSAPKLIPLLGAARVEELRQAVQPTVQVWLIVRTEEDGDASPSNTHSGQQVAPPWPDGLDDEEPGPLEEFGPLTQD